MKMALSLLMVVFCTLSASADIYRYVDEEGIECFTDAPRKEHNPVRIMKEPSETVRKSRKSTSPMELSSAVIAGQQLSPEPDYLNGNEIEQRMLLPVSGRITSATGMRNDPLDGKLRHHNGIDIATPQGTPVKPVADGRVLYSGFRPGYGNMVMVDHLDGAITLYAHNSVNLVQEGEPVGTGKIISLTGSTGRSTGPHLHFEAWRNGVNITSTYMPTTIGSAAVSGNSHRNSKIRRIVQADGTIRFTNLD